MTGMGHFRMWAGRGHVWIRVLTSRHPLKTGRWSWDVRF